MLRVDFQSQGTPLGKVWKNCVGAGRANEGLRADWQEQLGIVKEDCDFRYIRFHGLLHDDMHVYRVLNGAVHYNFQYVDKLFDSLLEKNIRPFVEFGFMPKDLASTDRTQFWWAGNVAPPDDYGKWEELIERCCNHWVERYGLIEVCKWYFEIWNEPNLGHFWDGTRSQYFELYRRAVRAIKKVCPDFRVGGPATSNFVPDDRFHGEREDTSRQMTFKGDLDSYQFEGVWIKEFLAYCEREKLPVDFVSCHPYPTDYALDLDGKTKGATRYKDSIIDDLKWVQSCIKDSAYPNAELHCTEWSSSPSSRDYSHDFLPEAVYIIRSNLAADGLCDSLSYWVFTDIFEELGAGPDAFHGGFGLLNLQGVKKPAFHAYRFLFGLGDTVVAREEGYVVTRKAEGELAALFYHYPESYRKTIPMSLYPDYHQAKGVQEICEEKVISMEIRNLLPGSRYELEVLGKESVAADLWIEMGSPNAPSKAQTEKLKERGNRTRESILEADGEGVLHLELTLQAWESAMLRQI